LSGMGEWGRATAGKSWIESSILGDEEGTT
jgi:hypothetical protein